MIWTKVNIFTTNAGIEPVTGILLLNGVNGYEVEDSAEFRDFLQDKEVMWDYIEDDVMELLHCETRITFYLTDDAQGRTRHEDIKAALLRLAKQDEEAVYGSLRTNSSQIADEDWENNWKKHFKPLEIGENLLIKPTWENIPQGCTRKIVEIDPSSSFGTGSHTTTQLCIEQVEKMFSQGMNARNMLDVGCGSGIIGIAAHKLGAEYVCAVDIEENSVRIAKENFEVNKIPENAFCAYVGDIISDEALFAKIAERKYEIIAANIVSDVLKAMSGLLYELLSENGRIVISGIISERAKEVENKFLDAGFIKCDEIEKNEWTAIVFTRR